ncbi:hypothetical protein C8F01DRAFT_1082186 [Mycena amicta]|nr:hypothetical protein C8F01DRAFT_1082186 [Mycena amicta]
MSEIKTLFGLQSIKCEILHTPLILSPHSSRDGMPAVSKSKRKKAQVITQNRIDSLTRSAAGKFKRIFDEITRSPQKLATVFSPRKKRRCTEGKENKMPIDASSVAGASSTLPVNPPPRIDSDDPFLVSTGQFQLEGSGYTPPTEASTSTQRYWKLPKLPKPTVEEVDDDDTASISTFISPTPAHPLTEHLPSNLSLHDQSTDDFPWDFDFDDIYLDDLSVPEQEDELLATQAVPLFSDDGYPRPRPPTSFLQRMEQYSTRPGKLREAPLVSEAELAAADVQKELRGDYRGSATNVLFGRGGVGYRDPDVRELG